MPSKASVLMIAALYSAACVAADEAPKVQPPPLWSGDVGWLLPANSSRVHEGTLPIGAVIAEHDTRFRRTGTLKQSVRLTDASGAEMILPEGSKAFAVEMSPPGSSTGTIGAGTIEWCVVPPQNPGSQPETVCIYWQNETTARYDQYLRPNGFAFQPVTAGRLGMQGALPQIEEGQVDFGVQFTYWHRLVALSERDVTIETIYTDGTHTSVEQRETSPWTRTSQFLYKAGNEMIELTRTADGKSVNVRRRTEQVLTFDRMDLTAAREVTAVLEALVGVDGRIKEGRVVKSTGNAATDAKILAEVKRSWKLAPGQKNGKPVEQWGRFTVVFKLED